MGTAQMPQVPAPATRVDVNDKARQIGTQIAATGKGFMPYDKLAGNTEQLAHDYERLRLRHELSREIALERDLPTLLEQDPAHDLQVRARRSRRHLPDESAGRAGARAPASAATAPTRRSPCRRRS